jgi:prepilin-type N-terminal cleavage/methylation domain-containing protein
MNPASPHHRRGMTLVELLVVIMILGLLSVVVLPTITDVATSRRYREAARNVSAFLARSQSRAIGVREPRGFMLQPLAADPSAGVEVFLADTPEAYAGETTASFAKFSNPDTLNTLTSGPLAITFDAATTDRLKQEPTLCAEGDAIQFGATGPRFKFLPPNREHPNDPYQVSMWQEDNQNPRNTAWPRSQGGVLPFRIYRQPARAAGGFLQMPAGVAIDIAWSCLGTRPFSTFLRPNQADQTITLLFDASGKPLELVHSGGVRTSVAEPLFLLIGETELCGNAFSPAVSGDNASQQPENRLGANWQYGDCVWLCVDNNSGVVKFGMVAPRAKTVLESQAYVRMTIGFGSGER